MRQSDNFCDKSNIFWQNIAIAFQNQLKYPWIEIFDSHGQKILPEKMSFYRNIALSFYCNIAHQNCSSDEGLNQLFYKKKQRFGLFLFQFSFVRKSIISPFMLVFHVIIRCKDAKSPRGWTFSWTLVTYTMLFLCLDLVVHSGIISLLFVLHPLRFFLLRHRHI